MTESKTELLRIIDFLIEIYPKYKNQLTLYLEGYKAKQNNLQRAKKNEWYIAGYRNKRINLVWSYCGYKPKINYEGS